DEADRIAEAFADDRRRRREHLAHARTAARPFVADHEHIAGTDAVVENRAHRIFYGVEHASRARDLRALEPADFCDRSFGREIAAQHREMALRIDRLVEGRDDVLPG